jgi:hypothetical protein
MTAPRPPRIEKRRFKEFAAELQERAQAWISNWEKNDGQQNFGQALLEIAARFNSEVAERLDVVGEKMQRGFLDWLAVRRKAARPARLPVVFSLGEDAQQPVLAPAPVRIQVDVGGAPVVFETEADLRIVPGQIAAVVGVDVEEDAIYFPPPGLSELAPLEPLPMQWKLKSFVAAGSKTLQLDPEGGLIEGAIIETDVGRYKVGKADGNLVPIEPELDGNLDPGADVRKVTTFAPFDRVTRNEQEHVLYLGDSELLNIEGTATIDVVGADGLSASVTWQYWGKKAAESDSDTGDDDQRALETTEEDAVDWQALTHDTERQETVRDGITLSKPKGAMEELELDGRKGRWIRAYRKTVAANAAPLTSDAISVRINSSGCGQSTEDCPPKSPTESLPADGMANTTPLVLDNFFFPLGKQPRQFDAFYLGCQEAFSKKDAEVRLCFEMADRSFAVLAAARNGAFANSVLAGVGKDRNLHLLSMDGNGVIGGFHEREPLQPSQPSVGSGNITGDVALDPQPAWRLPVWSESDGFYVGTTAGDAVWLWREAADPAAPSGWIDFARLTPGSPTTSPVISALVYLANTTPESGVLIALKDGELFRRDRTVGSSWESLATDPPQKKLKSIVPILAKDASNGLATSIDEGMLAIDESGDLLRVTDLDDRTPLSVRNLDYSVSPVGIVISGELAIGAVRYDDPPKLVAKLGSHGQKSRPLDGGAKVLTALDAAIVDDKFNVFAAVGGNVGTRLAWWTPFESGDLADIFWAPAPRAGVIAGAPTTAGNLVVIPGARADILVNKFTPSLRLPKSADIEVGLVVTERTSSDYEGLEEDDLIVRIDSSGWPVVRKVEEPGVTLHERTLYPIANDFPSDAEELFAFRLAAPFSGTLHGSVLTLNSNDDRTQIGDWLYIDPDFWFVEDIERVGTQRKATLVAPDGSPATPASRNYVSPINQPCELLNFMNLDTSENGSGDWDAGLLARLPLIFPDLTPREQRGTAFRAPQNKPEIVVLGEKFSETLSNSYDFIVDAALQEWRCNVGDTSANPELSWEYWDGRGWSRLNTTTEGTQNLRATGYVIFEVPDDIATSDWAGKTNFWIRARLIGGDYGSEEVTIESTTEGNVTTQRVKRSATGIRPPAVIKLYISYSMCAPKKPKYILAKDSGTIRDQSDANRTPGAIVEAFVPLAATLARLSSQVAAGDPFGPVPGEASGCGRQEQPASAPPPQDALSDWACPEAVGGPSSRQIFIGLSGTPSEAPVNLLGLVDQEKPYEALAPLLVDVLLADRLQRIVADDATRAFGESGILSMSLAEPPASRDLFGKQALKWLRLMPSSEAKWEPVLHGLYLNAAWASATETLTRELLGSSDGSPFLTGYLARPPVLDGTLELRVREPLGEEERETLLKGNLQSVQSAVEGLPGDWVLWKQVTDPGDEAAGARVYSLDESTGEIRFGDGRHGKIPPIGPDAIVAFRYCRTEPDPKDDSKSPGNSVVARTALNLATPVESVESVIAADQAAGGAPPESAERVMRFGLARLRHRNRAVTMHDLEDLALESSPDILQARATVRHGRTRLIVVMRGASPQPSAAQTRELRRILLSAAPTTLSDTGALRITGPKIRRLRIVLKLLVQSLDHAGDLSRDVKKRLLTYFDTALGGVDQSGWALGAEPEEDDVAFAIRDARHLGGIENIRLDEVKDDGTVSRWQRAVQPGELVMLADDPVGVLFETAEAVA